MKGDRGRQFNGTLSGHVEVVEVAHEVESLQGSPQDSHRLQLDEAAKLGRFQVTRGRSLQSNIHAWEYVSEVILLASEQQPFLSGT